jgi:hypothetical protein
MNESAPTIHHPMTRLSGVSVIFDWGQQARGQSVGMYSQADLVDLYGYRLNEELEYEDVRTYFINTRRPGLETEQARFSEVPSGFVPLFLSLDWHSGKMRQYNSSTVEYSGDLYKMAERLCEALGEWGKNCVYGHRVSRPVVVDGPAHVRIKPFALNGPQSTDYIGRLDGLGIELGRAIGEFCRTQKKGLRNS